MFAMRRLIYMFYDELKFLLCTKLPCFSEHPNAFLLILEKENRNHWQAVWTLDSSKIHTARQEKLAKRGATKLQLSISSISSIRGTPAERLQTHCRPKYWPQSSHWVTLCFNTEGWKCHFSRHSTLCLPTVPALRSGRGEADFPFTRTPVFTSATDWMRSLPLSVTGPSWPLCVTWTNLEIGLTWVNTSKHEKR